MILTTEQYNKILDLVNKGEHRRKMISDEILTDDLKDIYKRCKMGETERDIAKVTGKTEEEIKEIINFLIEFYKTIDSVIKRICKHKTGNNEIYVQNGLNVEDTKSSLGKKFAVFKDEYYRGNIPNEEIAKNIDVIQEVVKKVGRTYSNISFFANLAVNNKKYDNAIELIDDSIAKTDRYNTSRRNKIEDLKKEVVKDKYKNIIEQLVKSGKNLEQVESYINEIQNEEYHLIVTKSFIIETFNKTISNYIKKMQEKEL